MIQISREKNKAKIYTVDRYNENIIKQIKSKDKRLSYLLIISLITAILFRDGPVINSSIDLILNLTKICWVISLPFFVIQYVSSYTLLNEDVLIDTPVLLEKLGKINDTKIFFTILTLGKNLETLQETVQSNKYWIEGIKKKYMIEFESETWVITEEDSYMKQKKVFERLENLGARLVIVPKDYKTSNNTQYKARALQYVTDFRMKKGFNTKKTWIYHQDEETMIGEDTVLGILDLIVNSDQRVMGSGIILYPQNWSQNYLSIQETTRSVNDIGLMGQIKYLGYSALGYHGSHFIIRADIEENIGWDFGLSRSEDLLFSIKVKNNFGNQMMPLKGFAYEKPPFTYSDQKKQRKRWVLGAIEILSRDDICAIDKITITYGLLSWLSAFPSILSAILNLYMKTGGLVRYGGFLAGFIWFLIYYSYLAGSELHDSYIDDYKKSRVLNLQMLPQYLAALMSDAVAPWNAIIFPNQTYDIIQKDEIVHS